MYAFYAHMYKQMIILFAVISKSSSAQKATKQYYILFQILKTNHFPGMQIALSNSDWSKTRIKA
jgi:hypothetical protein